MTNDLNLTPAEYADFFVERVRAFDVNLDYGIKSIELVDRLLQSTRPGIRQPWAVSVARPRARSDRRWTRKPDRSRHWYEN